MTARRPKPLTPPGSNLASFDWFPLYYRKLIRSEFWRAATGDVCKISVELWIEAWQQTPCASLPNDDEQLALMAGFGRRGLPEWKAIKRAVMKAWTLCEDGRWYHKELSRVANERLKIRERWRDNKRRVRTENVHEDNDDVHEDSPRTSRGRLTGASLLSSPLPSESDQRVIQERELDSQDRARVATPSLTVHPGGKP